MTRGRVLLVLALLALFLYLRWPSASSVVGDTWSTAEASRVEYQGFRHLSEFVP